METPDAILLAKAGESQRVCELVDSLKRGSSKYHIEYMTVRCPWGSYTVLESNASKMFTAGFLLNLAVLAALSRQGQLTF